MSVFAPSSSTVALEAALSPEMRFALRETARLHRVTTADWPSVPCLRVFQSSAVLARAESIYAQSSSSWEGALMTSCEELGVGFDAMRSKVYRAEVAAVSTGCKKQKVPVSRAR